MQRNTKIELSKSLQDTIAAIKANSKDAHFTESLIADLLSYKGQLDHEPTLVHLPLSKIKDSFEGDTFGMHIMQDGTAVYHLKGGMDIVCKPNLHSLNQAISSLIEDSKNVKDMDEETKNAFEAELQASAYVLNVPMFAFSDIDFMFDTASSVVKFLMDKFGEEMNKELKEETIEEDKQFEEAVMNAEAIRSEVEKEEQNASKGDD